MTACLPRRLCGDGGVLEEYRSFLPVSEATLAVSLQEGATPLLLARRLSERVGAEVWLKIEGANPTGSFKDRGMTVAISKAAEAGTEIVVCASTGNTSASAAAYASKAGIRCVVLIPEGHIALGKLAQALVHGATVVQIQGNFDTALSIVRDLPGLAPVTIVNSINPDRIAGQMTGAFEIVDVLGDAPDVHCLPVGNAGNITAYWRGYCEYKAAGLATRLPRMFGFQAAGAAPIVEGRRVEAPETIATAIRIGNPASWYGATAASSESGGRIEAVTDEEILEAYLWLARGVGVLRSSLGCVGRRPDQVRSSRRVACRLRSDRQRDERSGPGRGSDIGPGPGAGGDQVGARGHRCLSGARIHSRRGAISSPRCRRGERAGLLLTPTFGASITTSSSLRVRLHSSAVVAAEGGWESPEFSVCTLHRFSLPTSSCRSSR